MAQNITLMGASYSAVPAVTLPKTGGGTATFTDVTDTTAAASDVATGKYFYTAAGVRTAGTNSGGGGGGGMQLGIASATPASASASISFTGLSGEPTSFAVVSSANLATGASPYKTAAVVFDGTNVIGQYITNTSNAQMTYSSSAFSKSYSNGTLTITGTGTNFQANAYTLVYTYGGSAANIGTEQVQVGSGVTSITFTGLPEEPTYWSCLFTDNIGTSSGYTRAHAVVFDGADIYGMEMGSGSSATENWTAVYNNGSLTITSQSTSAGGYFHQPGYYQLTYGVGGEAPAITTEPLSVASNGIYTAPRGKAYTPVTVNVSGGGGSGWSTDTKTATGGSTYPVSLNFTSMKGEPKAFFLRTTSQISSSGSTTYYYITAMRYNGTDTTGNCFRIGSTRRIDNVTSGYSWSYSGTTLTITSSAASRSASPGAFYSGDYELVYFY